MEHNVIEIEGVEYKAVKGESCFNCQLQGTRNCNFLIECTSSERSDKTHAVYKRHYRLSGRSS
jgi:hypothetical protein